MAETTNAQDPPLIDFSQLDSFLGIGATDFFDILGDIIHDVPLHLEGIQSAIVAEDETDLKFRAHSLRGMLGNVGCVELIAVLHGLESLEYPCSERADSIHLELQNLWLKSLVAITDWCHANVR